jgi:hypothetical protein
MTVGDLFPLVVTALLIAAASLFLWGERRRQERVDAENERLRHENYRLLDGSLRLVHQVEEMDAIPVWRPFADATPGGEGALVRTLRERFTREELALLAHEIGINAEDIGGQTLPAMALRLAEAARHRGIEDRLRDAVRRARPNAGA